MNDVGSQNDLKNGSIIYKKSMKKWTLKTIPHNVQKSLKSDAPDFEKSRNTVVDLCGFSPMYTRCGNGLEKGTQTDVKITLNPLENNTKFEATKHCNEKRHKNELETTLC